MAFEQAWISWQAGSLGIGAVLADADDRVVTTGRNRVLESACDAPLAGSLLGHAEMTAFAELGLRTARGLTLYTTVEPCLMCTSVWSRAPALLPAQSGSPRTAPSGRPRSPRSPFWSGCSTSVPASKR